MREPLVPQAPTIAKINVTPIIDVALVLVIILLITAPILSITGMKLDLPQAATRGLEEYERLSITLAADGKMAIDEKEVPREELGAKLRSSLDAQGGRETLVIVRADEGTPYGVIRGVLAEARSAGAERLAIATRQGGAHEL